MTTQPRGGIPQGFPQSQSQPIPTGGRFPQQQFTPNQVAYSPRNIQPSSSPLPQPPYGPYSQQAGVSGGTHDMYKGTGISGTPPAPAGSMIMQPGYFPANGGHRAQRAPPMPNQYYYPQTMMRYQNMAGPPTSPSFYTPRQAQYQYVQAPHIGQQPPQIYNSPFGPQYNQPPPHTQITPIQTQSGMPQGSSQKRKKIITIKDPNTHQDVTDDILKSSRPESLSTPPSGRSSATPPHSDIPAQFAAQVAAAVGTTKSGVSPLVAAPTDTNPMMINQNSQLMQPMHDAQIVGSPSLGGPMVPPNPPFMNLQTVPPASSPRPPMMGPYMTQIPAVPPSATMMSSSPSHAVNPPPMGMPPHMQEQQPLATAYQLPPSTQSQQFGMPNVHVHQVRPNVDNYRDAVPPVRPMAHSTPPAMQHDVQAPPERPPQTQVISRAERAKTPDAAPENKVAQTTDDIDTPPNSSPAQKELEKTEPANSSEEVVEISGTSEPQANDSTMHDPKDSAAKQEEVVGAQPPAEGTVAAPEESLEKAQPKQSEAETIKPVASELEKVEQVPDKEDNAVRLEDQPSLSNTTLPENEPVKKEDTQNSDADKAEPTVQEKNVLKTETPEVPSDTAKSSTEATVASTAAPETKPRPASPTPTSEINPQVKVVPPTPPKADEQKDSATSVATSAKKPEPKPDVVQPHKGAAKPAEKQITKPRVKSPEPQKPATSESKAGRQTRKDSTSSDSNKQPKARPASQKQMEKPVVNGVASGAPLEPDVPSKPAKTSEEVPTSPKMSKTMETKPTSEQAKNLQSKEMPAPTKTPSVSSEKSSSNKSVDSEKTNGVAPEKTKTATHEIKYDDDQWSPLNPKGKRQYDSNFLLQFQYRPTSLEKPKDLPNIDIVLEQPHNKIAAPMQPMAQYNVADFTPNYMRGAGQRRPNRQSSREHRANMRPSMSGPNVSGQKIQKVVSIDRDVELKMTANAWKPIKRDAALKKTPEEMETLEVTRDVRAILNKLTPSTFTQLMQQVLALKIDTEKKLRGTIDLIFEKAIDEPNFSEAYANMCRQMTSFRVTPEEPPPGSDPAAPVPTVEFRKLLLTKCQREFEKNKSDQEHLLELKKKMEENKDAENATQLREEYEIAETKERRRTLGNIRFIGELFKLHMLTESIMHNCIMSLFKGRDDDQLESLCRLLTTIGKDLDHQKGKQRMDQYFDQISKIISEKRTSSRVRFMLQDVRDLRLNNWVPRAIAAQGPKTISQIRQDAKEEQELLQLKIATAPTVAPMKQQAGRQSNRMGSRGPGGEDGWTKVATPKPSRYDPNKMKLKPNQFDETKVTLGPSRGYMGWKSGSAGSGISKTGSSGYSPSSSMDRTQETVRSNTPTMMNRFSALSQGQTQGQDYDYQRRQGGRQSSREGSRTGSRGSMGPPSTSSSGGRTPRKDERTLVLEAARKLTSAERSYEARQKSRESSPSVRPRPSTPQQPTAHKYNTELSEEKMRQKSKNILEEFLSIVDFKEATECIEELNAPPSLMHSLVHVAHEFTLEKKAEQRTNVGRLMAHLLKRGRLSTQQYAKGLAELLEMATDYEIDAPKVWEYFAEQLAPVFGSDDTEIPLTCLAELAGPLREEDRSGVFVAEVVKAVVARATMQAFAPRWRQSNVRWKEILEKSDDFVEEFLARHKLEDLSDLKSVQGDSGAQWMPKSRSADEQYKFEEDFAKLLEARSSNEEIFEWVEKNVDRADVVKPAFIRALTISVCKSAIDKEKTQVVKAKISERSILLMKFIKNDPERELQTLYALQHLMVILEQPANLLRSFFDELYSEDVISEATFYRWEESDDPNEQEGRGVALASVNPFLTWLRTAELESD